MTKEFKFKPNAKIDTGDFWYDLFEGGYIKPNEILLNKNDITLVENAIETLMFFKQEAEEQAVLEEW